MSHMYTRLNAIITTIGLCVISNSSFAASISVSAATSLYNAFQDIAKAYMRQYPEDQVKLNFGASGALLQQMQNGAPVDVFASADQQTMDQAQARNLVQAKDRINFVNNTLVLITPKKGGVTVRSLKDLQQNGIKHIALGNPAYTPAGRYAQAAMEQAHLWNKVQPKIVNVNNVRQALDYVANQSAEAGFVFGTDAAIMPDKVSVAITIPTRKPVSYPIAKTVASKEPAAAYRFIRFIRSAKGQQILKNYGFQSAS
ncbi:MAG: molybdate ABC transporter substrate-binding protein [Snodgrassella sp.]|uniref:molybdate ABC transporter substrate-binding protein n=1 Tax=Snodgrassella sp. TaxID=2815304 RepID=UPI0025870BF5|nr:molybdate ABC transporter substrate-binding protein [Snodgrassella sp.]MCO6513699.1 molybdate ABC transporter substrate-binding protein [Snodgrassella sp.]MCO6522154.1 molybdate ABC transporter substrate-binding protein [Snodgrassella sp.]MCO6526590.1 molybdate ABC transporter substrate-binding protein [Snodgrassella sp.]